MPHEHFKVPPQKRPRKNGLGSLEKKNTTRTAEATDRGSDPGSARAPRGAAPGSARAAKTGGSSDAPGSPGGTRGWVW